MLLRRRHFPLPNEDAPATGGGSAPAAAEPNATPPPPAAAPPASSPEPSWEARLKEYDERVRQANEAAEAARAEATKAKAEAARVKVLASMTTKGIDAELAELLADKVMASEKPDELIAKLSEKLKPTQPAPALPAAPKRETASPSPQAKASPTKTGNAAADFRAALDDYQRRTQG